VDYIDNLPQILTKTAQQQQAQQRLQHPLKGLDSSKLEHQLVQQTRARTCQCDNRFGKEGVVLGGSGKAWVAREFELSMELVGVIEADDVLLLGG